MANYQPTTCKRITDDLLKDGYSKPKHYNAQDSDDVILVFETKGKPTVAARVNAEGNFKVGPVATPGLGKPLMGSLRV